jgi:hypothetical protein
MALLKALSVASILTSVIAVLPGYAQTIRVPIHAPKAESKVRPEEALASETAQTPEPEKHHCQFLPTRVACMGSGTIRDTNINNFYSTANKLSYFNQIKSLYNGASSSATVSADLASLNFRNGMQVTAGTNIQAGSSNGATANSGATPTLSTTSAAQAAQNMLYGGTIYTAATYPLLAIGASGINSTSNLGISIDVLGREGIDIQNFKSGTTTNVSAPPSHGTGQIEGYLQYNSANTLVSSSDFAGAVFIGGSYGYSYTSHAYARDYGLGNNVNNAVAQVSTGIVVNGVARIVVSRAFGPSQTFINSATNTLTTVNSFKSWSFGIVYQSAPPKQSPPK